MTNQSCRIPFTILVVLLVALIASGQDEARFKLLAKRLVQSASVKKGPRRVKLPVFPRALDAATAGLRVGYEDPSYFSHDYKKHFGKLPHRDGQSPTVCICDRFVT